jgi:hypothetical protein
LTDELHESLQSEVCLSCQAIKPTLISQETPFRGFSGSSFLSSAPRKALYNRFTQSIYRLAFALLTMVSDSKTLLRLLLRRPTESMKVANIEWGEEVADLKFRQL